MSKFVFIIATLVASVSFASPKKGPAKKSLKKHHVTAAVKATKSTTTKAELSSDIAPISIDPKKRNLAVEASKLPKAYGEATIEEAPEVKNQKRFPASK